MKGEKQLQRPADATLFRPMIHCLMCMWLATQVFPSVNERCWCRRRDVVSRTTLSSRCKHRTSSKHVFPDVTHAFLPKTLKRLSVKVTSVAVDRRVNTFSGLLLCCSHSSSECDQRLHHQLISSSQSDYQSVLHTHTVPCFRRPFFRLVLYLFTGSMSCTTSTSTSVTNSSSASSCAAVALSDLLDEIYGGLRRRSRGQGRKDVIRIINDFSKPSDLRLKGEERWFESREK